MWDNLKASIASVVRTNNNQEITGANLQSVLNTIVNSVGANATFAGVATPSTSPGTPDGPVFWIAGPGTYSNFGQLTVVGDVLGVFVWSDSAWHYDSIFNLNIDDVPAAGSNNLVKSGGVATKVNAIEAKIGYYVCGTAAATAAKTIDATGYSLATGGNIRIKMTHANTADAVTLNINSTGAKALFYNGMQASSTNSWEAGEVVEVYYDGTQFQCQASKGGEVDASKINYNNSQSGIAADNVQEALDEIGIKDAIPTKGSQRAVTSAGIYLELHKEYYEVIGTWLSSKYVDKNNSLNTFGNLSCVYNLDISGYHKLIIHARQQAGAYAVLLDENMNIIEFYQNNTSPFDKTINLMSDAYKNVRYVSISNYGASNPYIHGYKYDDESLLDKVEKVEEAIIELDNNVKKNTSSKSIMWEIPITVQNGYINSNGNFVEGPYRAVVDLDISEYSFITVLGNSYGACYNVIKDENNNILARKQNDSSTSFSRKDYPTAKYLSACSVGNPTLAICGIKAGIAISDMLMTLDKNFFKKKQKIIISKLDGFYNNNRAFNQSTVHISYKSNLLVVEEGWIFHLTSNGSVSTLNYITYNSNMEIVSIVRGNKYTNQEIIIPSNISYIEFFSYLTALVVSCDELESENNDTGLDSNSNILYRKVYVAIGDSFTSPIGSETIESGIYEGQSKVYPYIIGNRNTMSVINQGESGSVLNSYLAYAKYNNIPANVDYITIWYGINDSGHGISVGTVDDEPESITAEGDTSTCGGFNWFFKWLLTNRPLAHIGVIVTDFCGATRREAIIACCQKWGIPYLDLYDSTVPMIRTRGATQYIHSTSIAPLGYVEVCAEAKALRNTVFSTNPSSSNLHPNNTCHEWQSTIIENFMRGL